jgi:hypothetical protein
MVQEQRFRLATEQGSSYLLVLAHGAPIDESDLCRFLEDGTPVMVEYSGEPGLASGVAHMMRPA